MNDPDWSLWRSFAAVVETGSLSAAARELGLSQPTLGRHVEALEQSLGVVLFERTLTGFKPTETALRLYEPVRGAQRALAEAALMAEGAQPGLNGTVRITASEVVSHFVLPQLLVPIRAQFPDIAIEIVPTDSAENLLLREADIAIRMFRPTQLELVTRKLGELPIVCCAHESYLARRGTPQTTEELYGHDLIGLDRSDLLIRAASGMGFALTRDDFRLRTDDQPLAWQLTRAGLGIAFAQQGLVETTPGMRALLPQLQIPALEVWLTTHRELFTSRRIRAIYDALGAALSAYVAKPKG
ncbi:LysR family transcriptional regulator [Paradevosia shaoguanensis]|uniref:LysR family transcriptional regulator n=1 Tax=Paradevosia shaoguanensis TaxID=1335043 RepID=A0AA41QR43_9HYPH|nr:LysR family transcriptional regulator [Paradevosia shaoguanensis]MCF1744997.1 LysR family transcriptional regulator [Paradevosia shaoguanensis]MCI0129480.1 LysR family transcriptional regulator [Paradevosia shaoguanensis]